ncbi:hypothetical protein BgiMline_025566, partial [Biomphalaria glabrata]
TSLFVRVQSLSVLFEETDRVENSVSLKCRWETQANEEPTEAFLYKNSKLYYQCSLGQSDVSICSAEEISPSRFSYFYQEAENMIRVNIKNMISSDMDYYSCYVKQHNANISGKTLYLPLRKDKTHSLSPSPVTIFTADTTHSHTPSPVTTFTDKTHSFSPSPVTMFTADTTHSHTPSPVTTFTADKTYSFSPSPVTMFTADTTHSHTPSPVTTFTADTTHSHTPSPVTTFTDKTHSLSPSPVTMFTADRTHSNTPSPVTMFTADTTHSHTPSPVTTFTGSTTIHTDTTSQAFSSADTTHSHTPSPVTTFTGSTTIHTDTTSQAFSSDTIYIITSVASIGLVIVGVIGFFVIRNYRNKRGFYDVQKFHQIHLCRPN